MSGWLFLKLSSRLRVMKRTPIKMDANGRIWSRRLHCLNYFWLPLNTRVTRLISTSTDMLSRDSTFFCACSRNSYFLLLRSPRLLAKLTTIPKKGELKSIMFSPPSSSLRVTNHQDFIICFRPAPFSPHPVVFVASVPAPSVFGSGRSRIGV